MISVSAHPEMSGSAAIGPQLNLVVAWLSSRLRDDNGIRYLAHSLTSDALIAGALCNCKSLSSPGRGLGSTFCCEFARRREAIVANDGTD